MPQSARPIALVRDAPPSAEVVARIRALARDWDAEGSADEEFPAARLATLGEAGAIGAFVAIDGADEVALLRDALRAIGGADLSLGRIFEGHVNAIQLVHAYGDAGQRARLADAIARRETMGVWNTGPAPGMAIEPCGDGWRLTGGKSFATGGGHIDHALITVRTPEGTTQLVLAPARDPGRSDNKGWRVRGMRGTMSGYYDFDGLVVPEALLIGAPDDYQREPKFSAGAWRFAAVQLGAVEALLRHYRAHLVGCAKRDDPIQRARFAGCVVAVRSAAIWVARAAERAEAAAEDAVPLVLMARGVVEEAGLLVMEAAARGVGTQAFFDGTRIDRITRDLGLYLRQPVPDMARDRAAAAWLDRDAWGDDGWW